MRAELQTDGVPGSGTGLRRQQAVRSLRNGMGEAGANGTTGNSGGIETQLGASEPRGCDIALAGGSAERSKCDDNDVAVVEALSEEMSMAV